MDKFKKLKLDEKLLKAIEDLKFSEPSEIQAKTIPLVIEGKDVIGGSATGSGKTLAFSAGIIQNVKSGHGIQALILTPTRELADQITKNMRLFAKYHEVNILEIYGGVSMGPQVRNLPKAEIVVGTPGRILDLLEQRYLKLEFLKYLVLDEADRMFDMGFIDDVEKIIKQCPTERQTLLFSATINQDVQRLSKVYMKNPTSVSVESYVDASKLHQVYYDVDQNQKFSLLVHLLKKEHKGLVMVFCNTRRNTDFLAHNLSRYGLNAMAIHGGLQQNRRNQIMESFHKNQVFILVCTDVAARGLDIKNVSHVYNYDLPPSSTDYIHRIGRTARAGKEGIAVNLVSPRDYDNFAKVKEDDSLNIPVAEFPEGVEALYVNFHLTGNGRSDDRRGGGRGGGRGSYGGRSGGSSGRGGSYGRRDSGGGSRGGRGRDSGSRRPSGNGRSRSDRSGSSGSRRRY